MPDELRAALELMARRPGLPSVIYMARLLHQDPVELELRLLAAARAGWVVEEEACCGQRSRFSLTEAGLAALNAASLSSS